MDEEIWKDIEGYEGLYMVSNLGRVKSLNYNRTGKEKILKPQKNSKGRFQVSLCKNRKQVKRQVHSLVLESFVPNPDPENLTECNHKDENPENCIVSNLEWISHKNNINYGTHTERMKKNMTGPYKSKPVLCVETGVVYPSAKEAGRQTVVHRTTIIKCCRGKQNTAGGYHWQYAENNENIK